MSFQADSLMGSSSVVLVMGDGTPSVVDEGERGNELVIRGELSPLGNENGIMSSSDNLLLVGVSYGCWVTAIAGNPLVTASLFF